MKKTQRKLIALSLTLCLLLSLALPATAKTADNTLSEYEQERQASTAERAELDVTTVPEIIGAETANDRGHTRRVYEDEGNDLNKLVFGNDDGSKTMYLFNYPVKFLDKNGMIQDISLDISNSSDESTPFRSKSAGVVTSFSKNIDGGIYLDGNGVSLRLVPHVEEARDRQVRRLSTKTVVYPYNEYTTIEYSLTYTGFKEDIVVSQYTGQTEYSFTLHTNGLELTELDGNYYLVDGDQTIQATIGDIIVITADERNNTMGQLRTETVVENEEYLLTIVLDPEYLSDPNTAYPIRIDPTLEVNYDQDGAGAIVDLTIGSNATYSGTSGSVLVGLRETKGVTRTLMRFPGLNLSGLEGAEVLSATVELRDLLCEGTNLTVYCYPYTGTAWTETSTWSGLTQSWGELLSSNVITYNNGYALSPRHRYSFDITAAVQGWIDGDYAQSKGIIFKASSAVETGTTYDFRTFASYNRASNKPSLTVTYNSAVGDITTATGKDCVNEGSTLQLSTSMEGTVTWTSSRTGIATVSSTGVVTGIQAGSTTITASCEGYTDKTFTLWVTVPDGVYYFKNASSGLCMQTTEDITYVYTQDERDDSRVNQLWKVAYISNGNYVIRPLRNFSGAMTVGSTGYVSVEVAPADNSSVSSGMYWKIIHNAFGYALKHSGADSQTAMPTVNGSEGAPVYPSSWTSSMTCHWELEAIQGVFLRDTTTLKTTDSSTIKYIELGESVGYAELGLRYEYYGIFNGGITWSATDTSVSTVNLYTGKVTGQFPGLTTINIDAIINGYVYSAHYTVCVQINALGYELDYETSLWNYSPVKESTNCYSYAINTQVWPGTQDLLWMNPGISDNNIIPRENISKDAILEYIQRDAEHFGFLFLPCSETDFCPENAYRVALVVDPGCDYHWYRQNPDGSWSHKPGGSAVTNLDASGNVIYDPYYADRNYSASLNYTDYVGYFFVRPLNNMYTVNSQAFAIASGNSECMDISFEINKKNLPSYDLVTTITAGMTYAQITNIIGLPQSQITFGLLTVEYDLENSSHKFLVEYISQEGQLVARSCTIEGVTQSE